jgi:hypothetical protein
MQTRWDRISLAHALRSLSFIISLSDILQAPGPGSFHAASLLDWGTLLRVLRAAEATARTAPSTQLTSSANH